MSSYELLVQLPMSAGERGWSGVCVSGRGGESETIKRKARHRSWSKAGKKCYRSLEYIEMSVVLCEALH